MDAQLVDWLLNSDEPWTRYRTLVDLLDAPADSAEMMQARNEMLAHPMVQDLMERRPHGLAPQSSGIMTPSWRSMRSRRWRILVYAIPIPVWAPLSRAFRSNSPM